MAAQRRTRAMRPGTTLSVILFGLLTLFSPPKHAHAEDPPIATVTVTARKEPVVRKLDKTVHDVAAMPRAANGTAQDVLQSTPEVSVTADGRIAVKGNDQVTVLVDGKPAATMSGEERAVALQTMSGADIASVEVITNPSAAYQANGGAIVNIVLKRNRRPGARAQVRASAADRGLWNAGWSGDMARKNFSVHGSLAYRRDGTQKWRRSAVEWHDPSGHEAGDGAGAGDGTRYSLQTSGVFVRRIVRSAALGIDYTLSDTDSVSFSARHNSRRSRPLLDTLNVAGSGTGETVYHRISEGPNEQSDDSASLAWTRQGGGKALKATVQRSRTTGLLDKSYRDVFVAPAYPTAYSHGATRSARRLDQATLDWSRLAGSGAVHGQWGMGADLQDEVNDLHNYQASIDASTGMETPDPDTTNGYKVKTTLAAAYLTNRLRYGQWEALLGGRFERMELQVGSAQTTLRTGHWQAFNPSLHLEYALAGNAALTLSYRRSLQRPDPRDLNPFTTYVDAQNLSRGNPDLGPQRLASWEIGTTATAAQLSGSLGAFHRTSRATVVDARSNVGDVLVTSKQNGGLARSTGITGSLDWTPAPALRLGMDGSVYRIALSTPDAAALVRQHGTSGYLNFRAAYTAGQDHVSLDAHVQASAITPLGRNGSTSNVNLTWKRALTGSLDLTVNASDLFDGSKRTYRTGTATFRQAGFDHFVARRVYLGFVQKIE